MSSQYKTKILFISHSSYCFGAEHCLFLLSEGLDRQKYELLVVLPGKGPLQEKIEALGIKTRLMKMEWWVGFKGFDPQRAERFRGSLRQRINALAKLMKKEQIDLVFTNTSVIPDGALAAWLCGIPHVWYVLELLGSNLDLIPFVDFQLLYAMSNNLSERIVTISKCVKAHVEQFNMSSNAEVIYAGVKEFNLDRDFLLENKEKTFGLDNHTPTVCFIGFLTRNKGVLNLVDVAALVREKLPEIRFIFTGQDSGLGSIMQEMLREKHLDHAFKFLGFQPTILDTLAASDIFILPSLSDAFPLVVLEAMHAGKPVIATCSGGAQEMVVHGETGLLVPVSDSVAMAQAIISLFENPERMKMMGQRGKERVKTIFPYEKYIKNFERVFDEVVAQQKKRDKKQRIKDFEIWIEKLLSYKCASI